MNRMRHSILTAMMVAGILIISGCAGIRNQETAGSSSASEEKMAYREVFDAWTQEKHIYDGLATKLISKATFKSAAFRQAYIAEYARLYKIEGPEYDKLVADQEKAALDYHDIVIAAYVPEKDWNDFSKEKSLWKIYMTRDHVEQIRPLEIRRMKNKDLTVDYFYPYVTTWNSIYHVRFPVNDPKTGHQLMQDPFDTFSLIMTSVLGSVEFKWAFNRKQ